MSVVLLRFSESARVCPVNSNLVYETSILKSKSSRDILRGIVWEKQFERALHSGDVTLAGVSFLISKCL